MLTGEVKTILIETLCELVRRHQVARNAVTEPIIDAFMAVRKMF